MIDFIMMSQVITTLFLCGMIWFVQVVHYPLFAHVGLPTFAQYEADHQRRTAWVVVVPMIVELAGSVALLIEPPQGVSPVVTISGFGLVVVIWLSTFFLQVPRHRVLESGFHTGAHRQLVATNWVRTGAWSVRSLIVVYMFSTLMTP